MFTVFVSAGVLGVVGVVSGCAVGVLFFLLK